MHKLYNHVTTSLSELDLQMVKSVPPGGNWKNIPASIPSKRLEQIRASGGRTTYYGRLRWDAPAYTISTYFNRPGNGCHIHPEQDRLLSFREAARLQSFPDAFRFFGSKSSMYRQIGNAVPPLLAYAMARQMKGKTAVDLFCGAGGLSHGFELAGFSVIAGVDCDKHAVETWKNNHRGAPIHGDITEKETKQMLYRAIRGKVDVIIGGPPCQGFSTAGWCDRDDPRNRLWNHYLDVVAELAPQYFLIENVPGLLSAGEGGSVIERMQRAFGKIGYQLHYQKLAAEAFGVPQRRRRIFIIGSRTKTRIVFPEPFIVRPFTVADAIRGLPALSHSDGEEEVSLRYRPESDYARWLAGAMPVEQLFGRDVTRRAMTA